jgi:hypothetical protein
LCDTNCLAWVSRGDMCRILKNATI